MDLYIFNPEHDIVLAANNPHATPPKAARQLRHDLGFLPALWADGDDAVLVDDAAYAQRALADSGRQQRCLLVERQQLRQLLETAAPTRLHLRPWGWDRKVARELAEAGIAAELLPTERQLDAIRSLSHRQWAAEHLLAPLCDQPGLTGRSRAADTVDGCCALIHDCGSAMVKAPWSSSGRGVRRIDDGNIAPQQRGWIARVIAEQGCVMVEPFYDKVADFGVELTSDGCGHVTFCGLSLFYTDHGAYVGNLVTDEEQKWQLLGAYADRELLSETIARHCAVLGDALKDVYAGPLGIDMMAVRHGGTLKIHPCVEMNLRATMGHVALRV